MKAILATAFVVFLLKAIKNVLQYILDKLKQWIVSLEKNKSGVEQQLLKFTEKLLRYVGYIIKVIVFYLYIYYILSLFPDTRQYSNFNYELYCNSVTVRVYKRCSLFTKSINYLFDFIML